MQLNLRPNLQDSLYFIYYTLPSVSRTQFATYHYARCIFARIIQKTSSFYRYNFTVISPCGRLCEAANQIMYRTMYQRLRPSRDDFQRVFSTLPQNGVSIFNYVDKLVECALQNVTSMKTCLNMNGTCVNLLHFEFSFAFFPR